LLTALIAIAAGCGSDGETPPPPGLEGPLQYVALGDSMAFGVGAQKGYPVRYQEYAQTDTAVEVRLVNLGVPGWKSIDLLNAVRTNSQLRSLISGAQILTWDIGGNDLLRAYSFYLQGNCGGADNLECFRTAVAEFKPNWDALLQELLALRDRRTTVMRTLDLYNPYVAEQKARGDFDELRPFLDAVNAHIRNTAEANGILAARVHAAFNGASGEEDPVAKGYISSDGLHANDSGHKVIADQLRELGYAPLVP
jgi:lysophospholipase L1-like esterase